MNKSFYLWMMTIFSILFLVSFFLYETTRSDLKRCRAKETAYKSLIDGDFEKFKSLMKDLSKPELDYYSSKFFDLEISLAVEEKNSGNFGRALELVEKAFGIASTKSQISRALVLKGELLMKMERYDDVMKDLEIFLKDKTLPDRERALEILKEAAEKAGKREIALEAEKAIEGGR